MVTWGCCPALKVKQPSKDKCCRACGAAGRRVVRKHARASEYGDTRVAPSANARQLPTLPSKRNDSTCLLGGVSGSSQQLCLSQPKRGHRPNVHQQEDGQVHRATFMQWNTTRRCYSKERQAAAERPTQMKIAGTRLNARSWAQKNPYFKHQVQEQPQ